jgi:polysaccharide pyruvyl transferase CsaB
MTHDAHSRSLNVLVVGWYGAPNVGDEVLLEVLKPAIESRGGTVIVASVDPVLTREMHAVESVDFHNLGDLARALSWADVLIMGGGGIFQDHHPFHLHPVYDPIINDISSYARPVLMARQFGVPVLIWGHGVGPLTGSDARDLVRDIFNNAAAVSVRDDESLELLREIGVDRPVVVGADPGWLYKECCTDRRDTPPRAVGGRKTLVIVVREWSGNGSSWRDKLLAAIDKVVDGDWRIQWVAFQANIRASGATSDLQLLDDIRKNLPDHLKGELLLPRTPKEAWDMLASADAVFSMRLHASILGLLAKKPLVGLEYDDKMAHAHAMAGLPDTQRLRLGEREERYIASFRVLLGKSGSPWIMDDAGIARLEKSARAHLALLDYMPSTAARERHWAAGRFDWLATWLQQTVAALRETKERSRAAHELLQFRDDTLAQRDAELESLRTMLATLQDSHELAHRQSVDLAAQVKKLEVKVADLGEQLAKSHVLLETEAKRGDAQRRSLALLESELQSKDMRLVASNEQLRVLQLEWREALDEVEQKNAYISEKEIYIAQLIARVAGLEGEKARMEIELRQARDSWLHVRQMAGGVRRRAVRMVKMPFKFLVLCSRYGVRVALQQTVRRFSTDGIDAQPNVIGADSQQPVVVVPRPVRDERLLVICHTLIADEWPSRSASLIKAAARAGFFVRWCSPASNSGYDVASLGLNLFRVDEAGLLDEVRPGSRVLLADLSLSSMKLAEEARARGAEVILDFSSVDIDVLADDSRENLASFVSRAVSRDGATSPHLPGVSVESLPDAADNEEFDSYKTYAYPERFRKRRRNILVFTADSSIRDQLDELRSIHPHDQIHVVGQLEHDDHIRLATWHPAARAALLAAADVVVVMMNARTVTGNIRETVRSALIMERPVISDVPLGMEDSKNFHLLGNRSLGEVISLAVSMEDYRFVSVNTWLGRAETLVRASFPRSVSVVVLIHNNRKIIERCVSTLLTHCGAWIHEIVVVDNQSADGGAELVEQLYGDHPKVKLVRNIENGCSSGRNLGVKESTGEYIAFFDSDQWLTAPSCFAEAIHVLEKNPDVGAIGWNAGWFDARRNDLGGAISDYVPNRGMNAAAQVQGYRDDIGFLGTSGMFIKRELFNKIEGFDTFYDPTCFEDTDICFQIKKAGYAVAFRDLAGIRHQPHQTTGASEGSERYRKLFNRNAEYFRKKWEGYPGFFIDYVP